MMVFHKEKLVYLAVPKTGTSSIERALGSRASALFRDPPGTKHTTARGFERKFRKFLGRSGGHDFETCAVIREPISWLGSWFRYRQRPTLDGHKNSTAKLSFDDFVAAYLEVDQPDFAKVGAQGRFVTNDDGVILVNHLFQYERMTEFHTFLETRLGAQFVTRQINVSPKGEIELSIEMERDLRRERALDFEIHSALNDGPLTLAPHG